MLLNCPQVGKIEPLHSFPGVGCRLGNIKTIGESHLLQGLQSSDLVCHALPQLDGIVAHGFIKAVKVILFTADQKINPIKGNPAVVGNNTAPAVGIRQAGYYTYPAGQPHFRGINRKHAVIVGTPVFLEKIQHFPGRLAAVSPASLDTGT